MPKTREYAFTIACKGKGQIASGEFKRWNDVPFEIPPVPPSGLPGCKSVDIQYRLEVIQYGVYRITRDNTQYHHNTVVRFEISRYLVNQKKITQGCHVSGKSQGKVRENKIFSRSGNCQGILKNCQEILAIWPMSGNCHGILSWQ